MDFAPYQSSPPEHNRPLVPSANDGVPSSLPARLLRLPAPAQQHGLAAAAAAPPAAASVVLESADGGPVQQHEPGAGGRVREQSGYGGDKFHAWQSSLMFTAIFIIHLIFSWSTFLSWVLILADLALMAFMALKAYRDADTLDRYEVPIFGQLASRILDDE
ncbi:uncharacterized protein PG986_004533 [Apiospora aurea]|uniref:Uncharacterized protein n=1 Tax=Apiospora aurea TaxID=335848 RepID=A0ABR1QPF9_9PEZI